MTLQCLGESVETETSTFPIKICLTARNEKSSNDYTTQPRSTRLAVSATGQGVCNTKPRPPGWGATWAERGNAPINGTKQLHWRKVKSSVFLHDSLPPWLKKKKKKRNPEENEIHKTERQGRHLSTLPGPSIQAGGTLAVGSQWWHHMACVSLCVWVL